MLLRRSFSAFEEVSAVFLRINILAFVFVVVSRPAHSITLILTVTSACFFDSGHSVGLSAHHELGHRPLCLLKTSSIGGILVISDSKAPGIITFSQVDEILRRDPGYHTCPLGEDIIAAARIPFPAHRYSVVAAHRRVAAERDNNTD
jgi:hypothetical protein